MNFQVIELVLGLMNKLDVVEQGSVICMMIDNLATAQGISTNDMADRLADLVRTVNKQCGEPKELFGVKITDIKVVEKA